MARNSRVRLYIEEFIDEGRKVIIIAIDSRERSQGSFTVNRSWIPKKLKVGDRIYFRSKQDNRIHKRNLI